VVADRGNGLFRHIHDGQIKFDIYYGSNRGRLESQLKDFHVILTTYQTLRSDWETNGPLLKENWQRVVLDEGKRHTFES
jgi:SNF2 family DNA or RNA helicase